MNPTFIRNLSLDAKLDLLSEIKKYAVAILEETKVGESAETDSDAYAAIANVYELARDLQSTIRTAE